MMSLSHPVRHSAVLLAVAAVLCAFIASSARAQDQVFMKDGTVIEGRILMIRMMQVFIETKEGNKTIPLPQTKKVVRVGRVVYTDPDAPAEGGDKEKPKEDPPKGTEGLLDSLAGQMGGDKPPDQPDPPAHPKAHPPPPVEPPTAEELAAAKVKLIADIVEGVKGGKQINVRIALGGKPQDAKLSAGDETTVTLTLASGKTITAPWVQIPPEIFLAISRDYSVDRVALEQYRLGNKLDK